MHNGPFLVHFPVEALHDFPVLPYSGQQFPACVTFLSCLTHYDRQPLSEHPPEALRSFNFLMVALFLWPMF